MIRAAIVVLALLLSAARPGVAAEQRVHLFAAASTTDAVKAAAEAFTAETGIRVVPVFAASGTLARQIARGAPADLYLSANVQWMDHLAEGGHIAPDSRVDLLVNRLVLVAPADRPAASDPVPGPELAQALGDEGRLALGDPDYVPAGRYARQALESLGIWAAVRDRTARAMDVRAALALVARDEAPLGVVYATDARLTGAVRVAARFPADSHPPITYPAAVVAGCDAPEAAARLLAFLRGPRAGAIFRDHGFVHRPAE